MTTNENTTPTFNQAKELIAALIRQLPRNLTAASAQYWIENQQELASILYALRMKNEKGSAEWQSFFVKYFGEGITLRDVVIPAYQHGFDRVVVVPQGFTLNQVVETSKRHFKVYCCYNDLDSKVTKNDRTAAKGHAIRIRNCAEADEELRNKSANQLTNEGVITMTLMERLILELKYYDETGGMHLDVKNITLCAGSRFSDGRVPSVDWLGGKLGIVWYDPGDRYSILGAREAVPFP